MLGVAHWYLLRRYLPHAGYLIPVTALAFLASSTRYQLAQDFFLEWPIASSILFGGLLGIAQWLVLRSLSPRSWLWIFASTAGWTTGWVLGALSLNMLDAASVPAFVQDLTSTDVPPLATHKTSRS